MICTCIYKKITVAILLLTVDGSGAKLPSYKDATTLPSYEEAEQSKAAEAELQRERDAEGNNFTDIAIGTDGMFICTFICMFKKKFQHLTWLKLFVKGL